MITRRTVIVSALGVSTAAVLTACSAEQTTLSPLTETPTGAPSNSPSSSATSSPSQSASPSSSASASPSSEPTKKPSPTATSEEKAEPEEEKTDDGFVAVASASEIPVGSGKRFNVQGNEILITQPRSGTFRAFSAVCTHAGYVMSTVQNSEINCELHGSVFSAETGSVITGPASIALGKIEVQVKGSDIFLRF